LRASGPWATISLLLLPSLYFALEQVTALHRASPRFESDGSPVPFGALRLVPSLPG